MYSVEKAQCFIKVLREIWSWCGGSRNNISQTRLITTTPLEYGYCVKFSMRFLRGINDVNSGLLIEC